MITSSETLQRFKFTVVIFLIDWTPDAERSPSIFPLSSGERHPSDWFPGTTRLINRRSILIRSRGWEPWKTPLKLRGSQTRAQGPSKGLCRGFRRACRDTRLHQQEVRHFLRSLRLFSSRSVKSVPRCVQTVQMFLTDTTREWHRPVTGNKLQEAEKLKNWSNCVYIQLNHQFSAKPQISSNWWFLI